jgi:hypothetical protein
LREVQDYSAEEKPPQFGNAPVVFSNKQLSIACASA